MPKKSYKRAGSVKSGLQTSLKNYGTNSEVNYGKYNYRVKLSNFTVKIYGRFVLTILYNNRHDS
jgi:hypothetical protein